MEDPPWEEEEKKTLDVGQVIFMIVFFLIIVLPFCYWIGRVMWSLALG